MKIGIFDSGVGGLTVSKAVAKKFPYADIVYFGDSIHLPYGNKSEKNILHYSRSNVIFLKEKKCDLIIIACNTSTAIALEELRQEFSSLPIFGVIQGGVEAGLKASKDLSFGVIGTLRTIKSLAYKKSIIAKEKKAKVYQVACPLLVPMIEEGFKKVSVIDEVLDYYLKGIAPQIDTLILGCTHYPLLKKIIQNKFPTLCIIDSAISTANLVKKKMLDNPQASDQNNKSKKRRKIEIITNDDNEIFRKISKKIFPDLEVHFIDDFS